MEGHVCQLFQVVDRRLAIHHQSRLSCSFFLGIGLPSQGKSRFCSQTDFFEYESALQGGLPPGG
jgi:hypothetical protein